jgi:hypothetical protein
MKSAARQAIRSPRWMAWPVAAGLDFGYRVLKDCLHDVRAKLGCGFGGRFGSFRQL